MNAKFIKQLVKRILWMLLWEYPPPPPHVRKSPSSALERMQLSAVFPKVRCTIKFSLSPSPTAATMWMGARDSTNMPIFIPMLWGYKTTEVGLKQEIRFRITRREKYVFFKLVVKLPPHPLLSGLIIFKCTFLKHTCLVWFLLVNCNFTLPDLHSASLHWLKGVLLLECARLERVQCSLLGAWHSVPFQVAQAAATSWDTKLISLWLKFRLLTKADVI